MYKHIMAVRLHEDVPNFERNSPGTNILPQLGWVVHHFRPRKPCANTSCQLVWGVHYHGPKITCTNISCQLGRGLHYVYVRPKSHRQAYYARYDQKPKIQKQRSNYDRKNRTIIIKLRLIQKKIIIKELSNRLQ